VVLVAAGVNLNATGDGFIFFQSEEISMRNIAVSMLFCCILVVTAPSTAQVQTSISGADAILGEWLTAEGKARVQITKNDDIYAGKIIWLKEPEKNGKAVVDDKNPDEKLRDRPVLGMEIVYGFKYDEENVWTDGKVYDPESGNEYKAKITLVDEKTLKLRGYVLIPLLGRSELWTR
jgi:uncharacterized protein (DUF2147 family)